jgi:uncharacterized tellurite resistance protein B-like protein
MQCTADGGASRGTQSGGEKEAFKRRLKKKLQRPTTSAFKTAKYDGINNLKTTHLYRFTSNLAFWPCC